MSGTWMISAALQRAPGDEVTLSGARPDGPFTVRLQLGVVEP